MADFRTRSDVPTISSDESGRLARVEAELTLLAQRRRAAGNRPGQPELAAQFGRDGLQVGDHVVARYVEMRGEVAGQLAVAAAGQHLRAAPDPPVAVHRHRHVDVVQELREPRGLSGEVARRRQVMRIAGRVPDHVERGVGGVGGAFGDDVGHLLEPSAVDGQETEPGPQSAFLDDPGIGQ